MSGEDMTQLASMAKLKATRLGRIVNDARPQYYGGMGFMDETPSRAPTATDGWLDRRRR